MTAFDWAAIKAKTDIRAVIGQSVALKQKGGLYEGCCPFHAEKSPSFKVYEDHFHCFGCGAHGDVVDFVMQASNCTASEAIEQLGAGEITMDPATQKAVSDRARQHRRDSEVAIMQARARWDASKPVGADSHPYLDRKGIAPHMARIEGVNLLLPVYERSGSLQSVQSIAPDGAKLFHKAAPMKGGRVNLGIPIGRSIVCEGFATGASIFEAIPDRVCVAYSISGVKDLARELVADGHDVAIAADRKGLADILALGAELNVPVFVPPAPHDDFNDLAVALGHDAVAEVLRGIPVVAVTEPPASQEAPPQAPANDDNDPIDIWSRNSPPRFPSGLLPPLLERFATIRARMLGGDAGGLAMSALAVCAAAIPDRVKVKVKQHENWTEDARLWVMLIGDPSSKKSPLMRAAAGKLAKMDSEMLREHQAKLARWQADKRDGSETEKPLETRLRIEDVTMESAQEVCKNSPDGVLALQDELSGWFGGIEKYAGGKGGAKDRSFWLRAYNGGEYAVNRVSRGSFLIDNLSVSILGGIQPDALRKIMADATDDGLIQRFIPVVLQSAGLGVDEELPDVAREYEDLVEGLRNVRSRDGLFGPMPILFSEGARVVRAKLEREHHDMVCALEQISRKFAAHIGKFDGMFPRLCLIWHCIENVNAAVLPDEISADTAERVAEFLHSYVLGHSKAFYHGIIGISADQEQIEDVAGYILAHDITTVNTRILQRGSRAMRGMTRSEGEEIFEQLESLGWLEQKNKRSDAPSWAVNPRVFVIYAAKAAEEKARRLVMQAQIKQLISNQAEPHLKEVKTA